jgi:uncharacterized protein (DUF2141 family)
MRILLLSIISALVVSCAQVIPLTGGEEDIYAPTIDSSKTLPLSGTTNFIGDEIKIKFNEYIKLNNPNDNIIITPRLKKKPTITVNNKTFKLRFNEQLEDSTTYVINFNGAIQDITEKNDSVFQYVFSTGNYIDSLSISGRVTDAFTNLPLEKILIAVYPAKDCDEVSSFDSIPYKIKPTYLSQTNKKGIYKINYLKPESYYIFAIEDKNKNLLFDADDERIGFLFQPINVITQQHTANFRLFSVESDDTKLTKTTFDYPGQLTVILSNEPKQFKLWSDVELLTYDTQKSDSLIYWLKKSPSSTIPFYYQLNNSIIDTIKPIYHQPKIKKDVLKLTFNLKNGFIQPNEDLIISVNEPIKFVDSSKIHFYNIDSNKVRVDYHIDNLTNIIFNTNGSKAYYFSIDSLAFKSIYNHSSIRKISKTFTNYSAEDYYGSINLTLDSLKEGNYIVELLDRKNNVIQSKQIDSTQSKITFTNLPPSTYHLRLIKDDNQDNKWTSGSLQDKKQAEKVYYLSDQIKLRSKWNNDIIWTINLNNQ